MRVTTEDLRREQLEELLQHHDCNWFTIVGSMRGDEGKGRVIGILKGRVVSRLRRLFDAVFCGNGGAGAGHSSYTDSGIKAITHQLSSGFVYELPSYLGFGRLIDPHALAAEIDGLMELLGFKNMPPVFLDYRSPILTEWHLILEDVLEHIRSLGNAKIGTTRKGIGPMEALHRLRIGLTVGHLESPSACTTGLELLYRSLEPYFVYAQDVMGRKEEIPRPSQVADLLREVIPRIKPMITAVDQRLVEILERGGRIIGEGAQGVLLDQREGTYPFCTSTTTTAASMIVGSGLPLSAFRNQLVIAVAKVFHSGVGAGYISSQLASHLEMEAFADKNRYLFDVTDPRREAFLKERLQAINSGLASKFEWATYIQILCFEKGSSTGRGRFVTLPDPALCALAQLANDPDFYCLNWLDALTGLDRVDMVVGYLHDGKPVTPFNFRVDRLTEMVPIYKTLECWQTNIKSCRNWEDLPSAARAFVLEYEQILGRHILIIGTGPGPEDYILRLPSKDCRFKPYFPRG